MYKYLFLIDMTCLLIILNNNLIQSHDTGFQMLSRITCKLYMYFAYTFSPLTHMLLINILVERYLSIKYPVESNLLRNKKSQFIYISVIIFLNVLYFLYIPFISDLTKEQLSNNTSANRTLCKIVRSKTTSSYLVFFSRIFVPFTFVVIFSLVLIFKIFNSRNQLTTFYSRRENSIFKRDVYLSVLAILSNFMMICFKVPLFIIFFITRDDKSVWFVFCLHLYHLSYVFYFYFFLITNSMFRKEFISLFYTKSKKPKRKNVVYEEEENQFNETAL